MAICLRVLLIRARGPLASRLRLGRDRTRASSQQGLSVSSPARHGAARSDTPAAAASRV